MTEEEFNANCIKSMETEPNVRFGGILCLMHYLVPEWAEEGTTDVDKSLYEHFKNHEYIVVFVYRYTRGKHVDEDDKGVTEMMTPGGENLHVSNLATGISQKRFLRKLQRKFRAQ